MRYGKTLILAFSVCVLASVLTAAGSDGQSTPATRVFADLDHTGKLAGPVLRQSKDPNAFVIVAPLPADCSEHDQLPEPTSEGHGIVQRLGRLRVEAKEGSSIQLSHMGERGADLRLYRKTQKGWNRTAPDQGATWTLTVDNSGVLELGIGVVLPEAKAGADEPSWPSAFTVIIGMKSGGETAIEVPFCVAPFLIPSSLDPVEELLIVSQPRTADAVKALEGIATKAKIKLSVHQSKPGSDQWMQDTIEPGVFTYPTADKPAQARAALSGIRQWYGDSSAGLDREIDQRLREMGVVPVVAGVARKNSRWIDWYGNLEIAPPHTDRTGRRFPYGRVITGKQRDLAMHPGVMKFIEAQRFQWPPIVVDTSWLMIGHVDEVVSFVPAKNECGFKVLLPSPKAAQDLLDDLAKKGFGNTPVFERSRYETTVSKLRERYAASTENRKIDETIAAIRKQLQEELSLKETDFVMLPALFEWGGAVIPNAVNSIVANGLMIACEPRGPRQDGKDLFEEAIRQALANCDVQVVFVDGWRAYHVAGGEVHCGTNTFRRLRDPAWWNKGVRSQ